MGSASRWETKGIHESFISPGLDPSSWFDRSDLKHETLVLEPQGKGSMVEKGLTQQRLWNALAA
ncbi:MAG TPA: hypothetical protein DEP78_01915 [Verrucomicrobiales bacterium]|nr:hypothetical protein [Pedosphaera sp.]HBF04035.1 hypothetical protein [Verrucomicrobiales bacterium]HCB96999.1 hypothetical protein [Verrucomicrobiales bacterium]HCQ83301.1 hypothetical protein [Verrucomicrobiales bacterium]